MIASAVRPASSVFSCRIVKAKDEGGRMKDERKASLHPSPCSLHSYSEFARGALGLFDEALEARDLLLGRLAGLRVKFGRDLEAGVRALLGCWFCVGGGRGRR